MEKNNKVVLLKLDRERELIYGHKALKTLVALTGKPLTEMDMSNFDLEELEKIVYCGLLTDARRNNEVLKLEQMEDLLDEAEAFEEVVGKVAEAINNAFGGNNEKN